ncbi:MAG TPA: dihydrofolate reductase family protein, partial [Sediminibacterium sp.]|nr:dihydrofolate reductase family protein [Sediminibacterium sp.]
PTAGDAPNASKHDKEHSLWYKNAHKIVLSRTLKGVERPQTTIISEDLPGNIQAIKQQEGSDILLFGSPAATHALQQLDLIDGYWLFLNPIILGQGIPLFANIPDTTKLKLQHTHQFSSGVIELSYVVERP